MIEKLIVSGAAIHFVLALIADQDVDALSTAKLIVVDAALQIIVAGPAKHLVLAVATEHVIVAIASEPFVMTTTAV